jgi:hypothetical protein
VNPCCAQTHKPKPTIAMSGSSPVRSIATPIARVTCLVPQLGTISQRASTPAAIAGVKRCDQRLSRVKSGHFKLTHYHGLTVAVISPSRAQ